MARRALAVCGFAAAQIGAPREYYVGEGADRVFFEVGWTDDVRARRHERAKRSTREV